MSHIVAHNRVAIRRTVLGLTTKTAGDRKVVVAAGDKVEHLTFTVRKLRKHWPSGSAGAGQVADGPAGDLGT